jgi:hypothetical protein
MSHRQFEEMNKGRYLKDFKMYFLSMESGIYLCLLKQY